MYLLRRNATEQSLLEDEFHSYSRVTPTSISFLKTFNPIEWWDGKKDIYKTLHLWTLNMLFISAMSAECERAFSSAKKLITSERNALADNTIEASECPKA